MSAFYIERITLAGDPPPVRLPSGELLVQRGTRVTFRMRLLGRIPPAAAVLLVPANTAGWQPLVMTRRSGAASYPSRLTASWSEVRTVATENNQRLFVRLDLPPLELATLGSLSLRFTCMARRVSARLPDWLPSPRTQPAAEIRLSATDNVRVVTADEYRRQASTVRNPLRPLLPRSAAPPQLEAVDPRRTSSPGFSPRDAVPETITDAQQLIRTRLPAVATRATSSTAFEGLLSASDIASMERSIASLEAALQREVEEREGRAWARARTVYNPQGGVNLPITMARMWLDRASAPPGTSRVLSGLVFDALEWVPVVGDAISFIEAWTGEELGSGNRLSNLESGVGFGLAIVGMFPVFGDMAAAALRPVARAGAAGGRRLFEVVGSAGAALEGAARRFKSLWNDVEPSAREALSRTLQNLDAATLAQLHAALEVVAGFRALMRAMIGAMRVGIQNVTDGVLAMRSFASRHADGPAMPHGSLVPPGGRIIRAPVRLDDGVEVHFIRGADGRARIGVCMP